MGIEPVATCPGLWRSRCRWLAPATPRRRPSSSRLQYRGRWRVRLLLPRRSCREPERGSWAMRSSLRAAGSSAWGEWLERASPSQPTRAGRQEPGWARRCPSHHPRRCRLKAAGCLQAAERPEPPFRGRGRPGQDWGRRCPRIRRPIRNRPIRTAAHHQPQRARGQRVPPLAADGPAATSSPRRSLAWRVRPAAAPVAAVATQAGRRLRPERVRQLQSCPRGRRRCCASVPAIPCRRRSAGEGRRTACYGRWSAPVR